MIAGRANIRLLVTKAARCGVSYISVDSRSRQVPEKCLGYLKLYWVTSLGCQVASKLLWNHLRVIEVRPLSEPTGKIPKSLEKILLAKY